MKKHFFLSLMVAFLASTAYAGEGHRHSHEAAVEAAPHGGILRDAMPFKAELILNGDDAKVYIYDKQLKPVVLDHAELKGQLKFPRQTKETIVTLKRASSGAYYETKLKGISNVHRYDLHIDLKIGDQTVLADFGVDNIH